MNFFEQSRIIENALLDWDFVKAENLKKRLAFYDYKQIPQYCKFLADIGKLDILKKYIDELNLDLFNLKLMQSLPDYKICIHMKNIDKKLTTQGENKENFFGILYCLSQKKDISGIINLIKNEWNNNVFNDISAENNMILNFAFNQLICSRTLDMQISVLLIDHIFVAKNMNDCRKKFILTGILNYFNEDNELRYNFFRLKEQYYNHIQKLMAMLHLYSDENHGAKYAMSKLFNIIQQSNNLSISKIDVPRVAICISGMHRNGTSGLESIYKLLAEPLKADVFMHTWDIQQDWIGSSRANDRFWFRTFNFNESTIPQKLKNLNFLKDNFSHVFESLMTTSYSKLDKPQIEKKFKFESLMVENQDVFMQTYNIGDNYKSRDSFNQIKMFYGMYKAFSQLEEYEKNNNIRYDYVIKLRPDLVIKTGISFEQLIKLNATEIGVPTGFYGIQDMVFYAARDTYKQIVNIFCKMVECKSLSPFEMFPKYDAHALMFAWLLNKNIKPCLCHIKYNIEEGVRNLRVPGLMQAIKKDCNKQAFLNYPEETTWLETMLRGKAK